MKVTRAGITENPFSSHLVEPACGGYIFTGGDGGLDEVIQQLRLKGWRGELVGPHGAGKSTLLTDICRKMELKGLRLARWRCSERNRLLPPDWLRQLRRNDIIILDGGERLLPGVLWLIRGLTWWRRKGLVITAHRRQRLGAFIPVNTDAAALCEKIRQLCPDSAFTTACNTEEWLEKYNGNAREVLFDLYQEFESRRKEAPVI